MKIVVLVVCNCLLKYRSIFWSDVPDVPFKNTVKVDLLYYLQHSSKSWFDLGSKAIPEETSVDGKLQSYMIKSSVIFTTSFPTSHYLLYFFLCSQHSSSTILLQLRALSLERNYAILGSEWFFYREDGLNKL